MDKDNLALIGHLMRRAGFGVARSELEALAADSYEAVVDRLLDTSSGSEIPVDMLRRYHPDQSAMLGQHGTASYWLYRMVNTKNPLQEKVALFWHGVFATGYSKLTQGRVLMDQIDMFRRCGLTDMRSLLVELSRDPSMVLWLDNHDNHKAAINENYGRELLELFSMGVGNYNEDDVKEVARAFTGWTIGNVAYMERRAQNDSLWPYGRLNLHFEYDSDDHDEGEKVILGEIGQFCGEDAIEIICRKPATAKFISRHMYNFFVADEPPVTQWPYIEPNDPHAIESLSHVYMESGYDIKEMLRVLFNSDFFKSRDCWYRKIKSPAELVAGVLKLTGGFSDPDIRMQDEGLEMSLMGQTLLNPPSVEGWHGGMEWIDTGTLVERINFASEKFGSVNLPGIQTMIEASLNNYVNFPSSEDLVQSCLDQMGAMEISESSRTSLVSYGESLIKSPDVDKEHAVEEMLRMVAASPEFQRG